MSKTTLEVSWVGINDVFLSPANPRLNDEAVPHVAASIRRFGWQQPIVAKRSGPACCARGLSRRGHRTLVPGA